MEGQQILIAADDRLGTSRQREFQILIVLWVAAICYAHGRLKSHPCTPQNIKKVLAPREWDRSREFRAIQDTGKLIVNRCGEREHVDFLGSQQCPLWNAIGLEYSANDRRGVEDDQLPGLRSRRSEL